MPWCRRAAWGQSFGPSSRCCLSSKWSYTRLYTEWQSVRRYGQVRVLARRGYTWACTRRWTGLRWRATKLGVKEQAIRKRIQRGTLAHDKDDDGRVHVYLAPEGGATGTVSVLTLVWIRWSKVCRTRSCTYGKRPRTGRRRLAARTPSSCP